MAKVKEALLEAVKGSKIDILDIVWFGGEATYEKEEMLKKNPMIQKADMIFAGIIASIASDTYVSYDY